MTDDFNLKSAQRASEFDVFELIGDMLAFCHHAFGPSGLREILRDWLNLNESYTQDGTRHWKMAQENALEYADELR